MPDEGGLRADVDALGRAVSGVVETVASHGASIRAMELTNATEAGRRQALGDCATKGEVAGVQRAVDGLATTVDALRRAHDQQRGVMIAIGVVLPVAITLLTKWLSSHIG
jgi:hypothetical protein